MFDCQFFAGRTEDLRKSWGTVGQQGDPHTPVFLCPQSLGHGLFSASGFSLRVQQETAHVTRGGVMMTLQISGTGWVGRYALLNYNEVHR